MALEKGLGGGFSTSLLAFVDVGLRNGESCDDGWVLRSLLTKGLIVHAGDGDRRREGVGARCTGENRNGEIGGEQGIEDSGTEVTSSLEMREISPHHSPLREMNRSILTPAKATLVIVLISDAAVLLQT